MDWFEVFKSIFAVIGVVVTGLVALGFTLTLIFDKPMPRNAKEDYYGPGYNWDNLPEPPGSRDKL